MFFTNTTAGLTLSLFWCYLGVVKETVLVFDDSSQSQGKVNRPLSLSLSVKDDNIIIAYSKLPK